MPRFMSRALSKMMSPFMTENSVRNPFSKFLNFSVSSAKSATPNVVNPINKGADPTANWRTTGKPRLIARKATSYGGIPVMCLQRAAQIRKHANPLNVLAKSCQIQILLAVKFATKLMRCRRRIRLNSRTFLRLSND